MAIRKLALWIVCSFLVGCAMGPDYVEPQVTVPSSWFRDTWNRDQLDEGERVDAHWWIKLNDPLLNTLVDQMAAQNLDVRTATSRLSESRAQRGIASAGLYPQINGNASYTREKLSDKGVISLVNPGGGSGGTAAGSSSGPGIPSAQASPAFDVFQYGLDVSWEIDLWGRVRRDVEASDATVEASAEDRRAVFLSSLCEVVSDYAELRALQARLAITKRNYEAARSLTALAQARVNAGLSSDLDTTNADVQALNTYAQIPGLEQEVSARMNAIALLLGQAPGSLDTLLRTAAPVPLVPTHVPIGVPSDLVKRRPDIREASAALHSATAEIGVAKADFFPRLTLMGNGMLQSLDLSDLNTWAARSYTFGPSLSLPLFEGGRLVSTLDLRNAQEQEAGLRYQKTVLTAFHEVDNALTAFRSEQKRAASLDLSVERTQTALRLGTSRYKQGLGDFLTVLTDEQNMLTAENEKLGSTEAAISDMIQLYKALGGDGKSPPPPVTPLSKGPMGAIARGHVDWVITFWHGLRASHVSKLRASYLEEDYTSCLRPLSLHSRSHTYQGQQ